MRGRRREGISRAIAELSELERHIATWNNKIPDVDTLQRLRLSVVQLHVETALAALQNDSPPTLSLVHGGLTDPEGDNAA